MVKEYLKKKMPGEQIPTMREILKESEEPYDPLKKFYYDVDKEKQEKIEPKDPSKMSKKERIYREKLRK